MELYPKSDAKKFRWEFSLIDNDETVNAWALPGGKTAVYTGLLPVTQDEDSLAMVMGHEISHAIAHHGAERMSQGMAMQIGMVGAQLSMKDMEPEKRNNIMLALGVGSQVGLMLPFSRAHESEADHIGLILMAKAGYDPEAALHLWERMDARGKDAPPEFLSTHPGYQTRQQNIRSWLAEARGYYRPDPTLTVHALPRIGSAPESAQAGPEPH